MVIFNVGYHGDSKTPLAVVLKITKIPFAFSLRGASGT